MTTQSLTCPSAAELQGYLDRSLDAAAAQRLEAHVALCPACTQVIAQMTTSNTTSQAAKPPGDRHTDATPSHQPDDTFVQRAAALAGSDQPALIGPPRYPFLLAPQQSDELGRLGGYRVLKLIGRGGMGMVFEAEDPALERRIALKVLLPELAREPFRARFLQEARAAAALPHDHIVTIYQVGFEGETPFIAMQFLRGETLEERLKRDGWLPLSLVLRIARDAALGLSVAHAQGLIHRDIKPANLWLEAASAGGELHNVKLLDFGIARSMQRDSNLTGEHQIIGTPRYMSPEQALGLPVDPRADLFSLGCVIYQMLSGEPLLGGSTSPALAALASPEPIDISRLKSIAPPALMELLSSMLWKDPGGRPAAADTVVERLRAIEKGEALGLSQPLKPISNFVVPTAPAPKRSLPWGIVSGVACIAVASMLGAAALWQSLRDPAVETPAGESPVVATTHREGHAEASVWPFGAATPTGADPIRVGVLHSLSGTMAVSEFPVADAAMLAVEELNEQGGLLGRPVEAVLVDGHSDDEMFDQKAEELITKNQVDVIFGCWTSSSRKRVAAVVERHNHLLVYPMAGEGLEESPNVLYLGGPNHKILPAVKWCFAFLDKRRFFLVGSDYVFPRAANAIIKDELAKLGGEVVGEAYIPLGDTEMDHLVQEVIAARPDVILNTINGDSNVPFFRRLRAAGITAEQIPTVSFSIGETDLRQMRRNEVVGTYACWCWFDGMSGEVSEDFVARYRDRYGATRLVSEPVTAAYTAVYLWAQAVQQAGKSDPASVRVALLGQGREAPEGRIRVDDQMLACWRTPRVGRIRDDLTIEVVWSAPSPVKPVLYPPERTRQEWDQFLEDLYRGWGNHWSSAGD